jgi:LuxR family maltose regulon positive regulatory protein
VSSRRGRPSQPPASRPPHFDRDIVRSQRVAATVIRPRLIAALAAAAASRFTVVTAPAGYGKTVLMRQWAESRPRGAAIVELARADGARTIERLLAADVARITRDPVPALPRRRETAPLDQRFVSSSLHALARRGDACLVVDGIDAPADPGVASDLGAAVAQAPSGLQVVFTRRSSWPTPVQRLALDATTTRLGVTDLAFTVEEARDFFETPTARGIPALELEDVLDRCGGWAVALRYVAIGLAAGLTVNQAFDEAVTREDRLSAYVAAEVLADLPPRAVRVLRDMSVATSTNASLAEAVSQDAAAARLLHSLARHGAFVTVTTGAAREYQLEPAIREVLRNDMRRREPAHLRSLRKNAAQWFLSQGAPEHAAPLLAEAEAWSELLSLLDGHGRTMFERGHAAVALRALDAMPAVADAARRDLALRRAYLLTMTGRTEEADRLVHTMASEGLDAGEKLAVDALVSCWAFWHASPTTVAEASSAVLAALETDPVPQAPDIFQLTTPASLRTIATVSRARALWYLGDVETARTSLAPEAIATGYPVWQVHAAGAAALLEAWAGNLRVAHQLARQARRIAARNGLSDHPAAIDARLATAHLLRERGAMHRAHDLIEMAELAARDGDRIVERQLCAVEKARWALVSGSPGEGLAAVAELRTGPAEPPALIERELCAVEARLSLAAGDVEGAAQLARVQTVPRSAAMQIATAQRDLDAMRSIVDGWAPEELQPRERTERTLWEGVLAHAEGDRRSAIDRASAAVREAEAAGYLSLFVEAGPSVDRLLALVQAEHPTRYLTGVFDAVRRARPRHLDGPAGLTAREIEIVRFLPTPLASAEIASRLYISVNTLKTHLQAIYRKLDVNGRGEAITRAEELGLA